MSANYNFARTHFFIYPDDPSSSSGASVTDAQNGVGLNGTIVELGFPLIRDTTIDGVNSYDFNLLNTVNQLYTYDTQFQIQNTTGGITTSFGVNDWQILSLLGADQWAIFGDQFGFTSQGLDGLGNSASFGITPISMSASINSPGLTNNFDRQSNITLDIIDDGIRENNFVRVNTNNQFSLIDSGTGNTGNHGLSLNGRNSNATTGADLFTESLTANNYELEFNSSHLYRFSALDDGFRYEFGDNKRGLYFEGLTEWEMQFFPFSTTLSSRGVLNTQAASWEYGDSNTGSLNAVTAGSSSSIISSSDGVNNNLLEITPGIGGYVEINTASNLGVRESSDFSANYVPLSLINKTYGDGNIGGFPILNAPGIGEVPTFTGVGFEYQTPGGGGGSAQTYQATMRTSDIETQTASANTVLTVRYTPESDISITSLGTTILFAAAETISLGVYDTANNLLVQSDLPGGYGTGQQFTPNFPALNLTAGTEYIFAVKGDIGSTNIATKSVLTNNLVATSQFFGSPGLPGILASGANSIVPQILMKV